MTLVKQPGSRLGVVTVEDDDPDGFASLDQAWTLFAESGKKASVEKRGRFNLGEKLVLALCEEAEIVSTTGGVRFDQHGRHRLRGRRERGTIFTGKFKLSGDDLTDCCNAMRRLLPPTGIETTFNGVLLQVRTPFAEFDASLRTEIADENGNLRPSIRKTCVRLFRPDEGETATLYEMGIPVVDTGDAFHVDVQQKIPLGLDRDSVPPAYLKSIRALVLNATHAELSPKHATSVWVREALGTRDVSTEAVKSAVAIRFGAKAVTYDPSDPEANKLAVVAILLGLFGLATALLSVSLL